MIREPKNLLNAPSWFRNIVRFGRSHQFVDSPTVRVENSTRGAALFAARRRGGRRPTGFRGEWSLSVSYAAGDEVKVSNGLEAGTYIAVRAVPANEPQYFPWLGGRWVLIGRVNDQSSWLA